MTRKRILACAGLVALTILGPASTAPAQNQGAQNQGGQNQAAPNLADEDFHVYTDAPRLLLNRQRLRLLQRERERQSMRWETFAALIESGAPMPEPGFALALHYRVAGNMASGRQAVEWALGNGTDLRQLALVFDWCGPVMTKAQSDRLAAKIEASLTAPVSPTATNMKEESARVLAAVAIADRLKDHGDAVIRDVAVKWWRAAVVPTLETNQPLLAREHTYALYEMLHVLLDNLKIDLRETAPAYFRELGIAHIAGHYPAPYPGPDAEYYIPVYLRDGEPNITDATMDRAAGFAMVAYDNNSQESQFLQGFLMQDRFLLKGPLGSPYEFLWANPYQPGLSYFHIPLVFHNSATGEVFARTSWDDDATWIGYFNSRLQIFRDGQVQTLRAGAAADPVRVADAVLMTAPPGELIKLHIDSEALFLMNLTPRTVYEIEIEDEEMREVETDAGGTLVLASPAGVETDARLRRKAQ